MRGAVPQAMLAAGLLVALVAGVLVWRGPAAASSQASAAASAAAVPSPAPVTVASPQARPSRVLAYLRGISGTATVAGQHNREPLSSPTMWTDRVRAITDSEPGLYGSDFAFTDVGSRQTMVSAAIAQWQAGSLVTLMWHMCPPGMGQTCDWKRDVQSHLTDRQWAELVTPGSPLERAWTAQIDVLVPFLRQLQDRGVEVLWRPVHELNDTWAWWGGRPGPNGSLRLFQIMHDHLAAQGLTNLIWVWSVKDVATASFADYYPGDRYVDVVALDSWMAPFPSTAVYEQVGQVAHGKPMALAEVGTLPSPAQLAQQPKWTYFMEWAEMLTQRNTVPRIQFTYSDPRVVAQSRISLPPRGFSRAGGS